MIGVHNNRAEIEKFITKNLRDENGCQIWTSRMTLSGFAKMYIGGAAFSVRRVVWWLKHGYLPQGQHMGETCGNPLCCNPDHLTDKTPQEDRRETLFRKGKSFNSPILREKDVEQIWAEYITGDTTIEQAAKREALCVKTIRTHLKRYEQKLLSGL